MKKLLTLALCALLCLSFAACGGANDAQSDYYKLSAMIMGDDVMNAETLAEIGLDWFIILNKDGTGRLKLDHPAEISWADGQIKAEDESLPFSLDGDKLIIDMGEDGKIEFTKSQDTPPAP